MAVCQDITMRNVSQSVVTLLSTPTSDHAPLLSVDDKTCRFARQGCFRVERRGLAESDGDDIPNDVLNGCLPFGGIGLLQRIERRRDHVGVFQVPLDIRGVNAGRVDAAVGDEETLLLGALGDRGGEGPLALRCGAVHVCDVVAIVLLRLQLMFTSLRRGESASGRGENG